MIPTEERARLRGLAESIGLFERVFSASEALSLIDDLDAANAETREAYGYATRFLQAFCENSGIGQVEMLPTLCGVLTQIDNATTVTSRYRASLAKAEARIAELERREAAFAAYEKNRDHEVADLRERIKAAEKP